MGETLALFNETLADAGKMVNISPRNAQTIVFSYIFSLRIMAEGVMRVDSTLQNKVPDYNLLDAARRMEGDALISIFDRFAPAIYKYSLRLCHDPIEADNIMGDVFAKLLDEFAAGKGPRENLRSYLYQMAYRLMIDGVRHRRREAPLELVEWMQNSGCNQMSAVDYLETKALANAITHDLTENQRHVIILRFLEDFNLKETSAILNLTVDNIKAIQNRGIAKLRKSMGIQIDQGKALKRRRKKRNKRDSVSI